MGVPAHRLGDICTGHGCFPPRPNFNASENVFVNRSGWHRMGDRWCGHCCGLACCSVGPALEERAATVQGSRTVHVNGRPAVGVGCKISDKAYTATGSGNVFVGDCPG